MRCNENPTSTFRTTQPADAIEGELEIRDRKAGHIAGIYDEAKIFQGTISDLWCLRDQVSEAALLYTFCGGINGGQSIAARSFGFRA